MSGKKVLFVDRDGTLIEEPDDFQVDSLDKIRLVPDVIPALLRLKQAGYAFVMVTNQDGLGTPSFLQRDFDATQEFILALYRSQGIEFDEVFVCPHLPDDRCACRKPATGLLTRYLAATSIDTKRSAVVGDRQTDIELADALGLTGFLLGSEPSARGWNEIADELCLAPRRARVSRRTKETDVVVEVALDVDTPVHIATGIGFFDHMLEQVARHGSLALTVRCRGDLEIDEHHTVEDTAIVLGDALREALGNKCGIERYGFVLPMDEAQARVALDLSGRSALVFEADFPRASVGELSTEMVRHFFKSLADSLGAAIHVHVTGENTHHMIEAVFKGFGRALAMAAQQSGSAMPSTKGTL